MARKPRDYAKEYQRRQELAKARGARSYGALRYAIEKGKIPAIAPHRIRTKRTAEAQQAYYARLKESPDEGLYQRELAKITKEQQCRDWSAAHAGHSTAKFNLRDARRFKMTKAEYIDTYYNTFVEGETRYSLVRAHKGDYRRLRHWMVDLWEYMDADDFDEKYVLNN